MAEDRDFLTVVVGTSLAPEDLALLRSVDPRLRVEDAAALFVQEWPAALRPGQRPPTPRADGARLDDLLAVADVLLAPRRMPPNVRSRAPRLRWVQLPAAGLDPVVGTDLWASDVTVTTHAGHAAVVAEFALMLLLMLVKDARRVLRSQAERRWDRFSSTDLEGKTALIVGYGSVGQAIGKLCHAFGMQVLTCRRSGPGPDLPPYVVECRPPYELRAILPRADAIFLAVPLTEETHHLINEAALRAMKRGAHLINVARGAVVDQAALERALVDRWIAGAGLDVTEEEPPRPESPLWTLPNVILSAHVAGLTDTYDTRVARFFAENLRRYLSGRPLAHVVDWARGY